MNNRFRKTIAWLLLVAYLPMLLASALHVHHQPVGGADSCFECDHHIEHPAHFGVYHGGAPDCLYCHLLSLPNLAVAAIVTVVTLLVAVRMGVPRMATVVGCRRGRTLLRAPPFCR